MQSNNINQEANLYAAKLLQDVPLITNLANNLAKQFIDGLHISKQKGNGEDFWQYKAFENGQNAKLIDWRQSAKTDRLSIKEREEKTARRFQIYADMRAPMAWSFGNAPQKAFICSVLSLGMSIALFDLKENIQVLGSNEKQSNKDKIFNAIVNQNSPLPHYFNKGRAIIITDGFDNIEDFEKILKNAQDCQIFLIIIKDLDEAAFNFSGRINFKDFAENEILIDDCESAKAQFIENYNNHFAMLKSLFEKHQAQYFEINTKDDLYNQSKDLWQKIFNSERLM